MDVSLEDHFGQTWRSGRWGDRDTKDSFCDTGTGTGTTNINLSYKTDKLII